MPPLAQAKIRANFPIASGHTPTNARHVGAQRAQLADEAVSVPAKLFQERR